MYRQFMSVDGLRFLIIDDHADSRELLKILFEAEGSKVKAVATSEEARNVMLHFQPDIVISEIYLPDEGVDLLLAKVKDLETKLEKRIPAIAVTSFVTNKDLVYALKTGFQMYLCKPINLNDLMCLVARLSRRKQLNTPQLSIT